MSEYKRKQLERQRLEAEEAADDTECPHPEPDIVKLMLGIRRGAHESGHTSRSRGSNLSRAAWRGSKYRPDDAE